MRRAFEKAKKLINGVELATTDTARCGCAMSKTRERDQQVDWWLEPCEAADATAGWTAGEAAGRIFLSSVDCFREIVVGGPLAGPQRAVLLLPMELSSALEVLSRICVS